MTGSFICSSISAKHNFLSQSGKREMTKIPAAAQGSDTRPADSGDVDPSFRDFALLFPAGLAPKRFYYHFADSLL